jgi:flagellar biosynthesis/type III secretory pathway protein FliH
MGDALRELMKDELEEAHASGMEQGREEGIEQGIEQGREEGLLSSVGNLMKSMHLSAEEAMKALGIPKEKMEFYGAKLAK